MFGEMESLRKKQILRTYTKQSLLDIVHLKSPLDTQVKKLHISA